MNWHDGGRGRNNVIYLTYEKLISNPRATLFRVITEMTGQEPDPWVVEKTVEKYDMKRQTGGRAAGVEDRSSFIRKGVAGDWVNHFSKASAKLFHELAGDATISLGYENDPQWWQNRTYPD